MNVQKYKRAILIGLSLIVALAVCASLALHFATNALKTQVQRALGKDSEVGQVVVGWSHIELQNVLIHAPGNWPNAETLRAKNVVVTPDLWALVSSQLRIRRIDINEPYLSIVRTREGKLRLLPSLLENTESTDTAAAGGNTHA
ncbi:MAG TPA: hypothetical protein VNW52_04140, partial [Burkholderiaceae bacterium]|nr:hypothetical protein [Burkholderiaceae bacterium]